MRRLFFRGFQLFLIFVFLGFTGLLSFNGDSQIYTDLFASSGQEVLEAEDVLGGTDEMLQFVAMGHVLGFRIGDMFIVSGDHALRVAFKNARPVSPTHEGSSLDKRNNRHAATNLDKVYYNHLWEGVTLMYEKHSSGVVKSTYTVQTAESNTENPVDQIRLHYNVPVAVDEGGNLILSFDTGQMIESCPIAWQEIEEEQVAVSVSFCSRSEHEIGFKVGSYNPQYPIVIDPVMSWHAFLGSSNSETGFAIAVDSIGSIYVAGYSSGTWGTPVNSHAGSGDGFAAKLDSSGALQWNTFMGSSGWDNGISIAIDTTGNVYVGGTSSASWGSPVNPHLGSRNAYAVKLDSSGVRQWNTFLGSGGYHYCGGIAVDTDKNVYLTGDSSSTWGTPINAFAGSYDVFAAKLNSSGGRIWSTFMGSTESDSGYSIDVDTNGNVYVAGTSRATWGNPVAAYAGGNYDAFAAKLNTNGNRQWNTFLGSGGTDFGAAIAVDLNGNVYVVGTSEASWGTPINAWLGGAGDAFAAKLKANGELEWNTFMGSTRYEEGLGIDVDTNGNIYVVGYGPQTWGAPINAHAGMEDAFAAKLNSEGVREWNTFMGSADEDYGNGIAVDINANVYVTGESYAAWGTPVIPHAGDSDAFIAKYSILAPVSDIKANGSDGPIVVTQGDALLVTVDLESRELNGEDADWWILMKTSDPKPNNWYYFDMPTRTWVLGRSPTRQGSLFDISDKKVPKTSGLAPGTYTFYFAVDMAMNGAIDAGQAYYDKVKVTINP